MNIFENKWDDILKEEMDKKYFKDLILFFNEENKHKVIFPKNKDLFKALKLTSYEDVKVLILGQDPYHGEGEANGLCFSVNEGVKRPPSLNNIFKELYEDLNIKREDNDLSDWAKQGVLLLNTVLTVEKDKAFSHRDKGWEKFTDFIITKLDQREETIVFVLWGNAARDKKKLIKNKNHFIIESPHPSPLSFNRGFKGSKPFSKVNKCLKEKNIKEINW